LGLSQSAFTPADAARLIDELTSLVSRAAAAILTAQQGALATRAKADASPVTAADEASEAIILEGLARAMPGVAVVSEEAAGRAPPGAPGTQFVLVDPLDGTRELVAGRDEFTVNVAIVVGGEPAIGIVAAPAQGTIWRGIAGRGADRLMLTPGAPANAAQERKPIHTRKAPNALIALTSRSHLDADTTALITRLAPAETIASGSSIKFCRLAEGRADIYPRLSQTCEWDVAAGHAVLAAAGGLVTMPDGAPLTYGNSAKNFRVPGFIACGDPELLMRVKR
jgi:3'(2'), 5'-bisphosphate nucleotidase